MRMSGVLRCIAFVPAILAFASGHAQLNVLVVDRATSMPMTGAHIAWQPLGHGQSGVLVSGTDGRAMAPVDVGVLRSGVVVRVSCMGFVTMTDTAWDDRQRTYRLHASEIRLDELVVTGQYAPGTADQAVQMIRVIDRTQLQHMAANNLGDALRNEPNIRLGQESVLGTSVSMQGLSGENVKILVDGVPVIGRLDGQIDLSQMDLTAIDRVEVIQGPLSVNFGSSALAGTINLITRRSVGSGMGLTAQVHAEHIGRLNTTLSAIRGWAHGDLVLSGGRNYFGGWDPSQPGIPDLSPGPADSTRHQLWKPREQYFGRLNYRQALGDWSLRYKGEVMSDLLLARGEPRAPYYETAFDEEFHTLRWDHGLFADRRWEDGVGVQGQLALGTYRRERNTMFKDLTTLEERPVESPGASDTTVFALVNARVTVNTPGDGRRLAWETGIDLNHESGSGERMGEGERRITDAALFGSIEYRPRERIVLRPGVRVAYNSSFPAPVVPAINVRWNATDRLTVRAAYAQGFRAPSLKEQYLYFVDVNHDVVGNPELLPEHSHNLNAALVWRAPCASGAVRLTLDGFYNDLRDRITLAQISGLTYTYANIGELRTYGGALGATWQGKRWEASAGTAVTGWQDGAMAEMSLAPVWMPELRSSVTARLPFAGLAFSAFYKYQGEFVQYAIGANDEPVRGSISAYQLLDANLGRNWWGERLNATLGCKDILDTGNVAATLSGGSHSGGGGEVPMTTGRTWFVRVQLNLRKTA